MNYINLITATANNPMVAATNYYVLKADIHGAATVGAATLP
jgi:hypothetical protein